MQNPSSTFDVGGGMTTTTLTVQPSHTTPRFTAALWDTNQSHHTNDLDAALNQIQEWLQNAGRP